jgi:hypothetical protein
MSSLGRKKSPENTRSLGIRGFQWALQDCKKPGFDNGGTRTKTGGTARSAGGAALMQLRRNFFQLSLVSGPGDRIAN